MLKLNQTIANVMNMLLLLLPSVEKSPMMCCNGGAKKENQNTEGNYGLNLGKHFALLLPIGTGFVSFPVSPKCFSFVV